MDLTRAPVQIDGCSTSQVLDGSQDQPMSIMITHEQNKILRIPNRDMSLKQQNSLHSMLTDIALDPNGFTMCVRKRRLSTTMQASTSSGGSNDAASVSGSLRGFGAEVHDSHAADERHSPRPRVHSGDRTGRAAAVFETSRCISSSSSAGGNQVAARLPSRAECQHDGSESNMGNDSTFDETKEGETAGSNYAENLHGKQNRSEIRNRNRNRNRSSTGRGSPVRVRHGTLKDYDVHHQIGKGKFSTVFYAERCQRGCNTGSDCGNGGESGGEASDEVRRVPCALKTVRLPPDDSKTHDKHLQEVSFLQTLAHPNIVRYLDAFISHDTEDGAEIAEGDCGSGHRLGGATLHIVLEWAGGGDLRQHLRSLRAEGLRLREERVWMYFSQCCEALKHMHARRIIHRDIKPANIFLMPNRRLKLGDLGLSRCLHDLSLKAFSQVGTPLYMSPEVLRGEGHDFASDIWSLGCLLHELCELRSPFEERGLTMFELFQRIVKGEHRLLPAVFSDEVRELLDGMLTVEPHARPDIEEVSNTALLIRASAAAEGDEEDDDNGEDETECVLQVAVAGISDNANESSGEQVKSQVQQATDSANAVAESIACVEEVCKVDMLNQAVPIDFELEVDPKHQRSAQPRPIMQLVLPPGTTLQSRAPVVGTVGDTVAAISAITDNATATVTGLNTGLGVGALGTGLHNFPGQPGLFPHAIVPPALEIRAPSVGLSESGSLGREQQQQQLEGQRLQLERGQCDTADVLDRSLSVAELDALRAAAADDGVEFDSFRRNSWGRECSTDEDGGVNTVGVSGACVSTAGSSKTSKQCSAASDTADMTWMRIASAPGDSTSYRSPSNAAASAHAAAAAAARIDGSDARIRSDGTGLLSAQFAYDDDEMLLMDELADSEVAPSTSVSKSVEDGGEGWSGGATISVAVSSKTDAARVARGSSSRGRGGAMLGRMLGMLARVRRRGSSRAVTPARIGKHN